MIKFIAISSALVLFLLMFLIIGFIHGEVVIGFVSGFLGGLIVLVLLPALFFMLEKHFRSIGFPLDEKERREINGLE